MRLVAISGPVTGTLLDFSESVDLPAGWAGAAGALQKSVLNPGGIVLAANSEGIDTTANVANWGIAELVFVRNTGAAISPGRLVHLDKDFTVLDVPNTANTGRHVYVTLTRFLAGSTTPQGGWVMRAGIAPVQFAVAATAGAVFIGAAGQATPTAAAGKQLLQATTLIAGASTFTRPVTTRTGSRQVMVSRSTGMYVGQSISGTGIPGGATISAIADGGLWVLLSAAATASGNITATLTNTNYGIVHFDRPFVQGQIT